MKAAIKITAVIAFSIIAVNGSMAAANGWLCEDGSRDFKAIDNTECKREEQHFKYLLKVQALRKCKAELTNPENCYKIKANKLGDFTDTGVGAE